MKSTKSRELLEKAIRALPQDFAMRDVRTNMRKALVELNAIENKREKRKEVNLHDQWRLDLESGKLVNPDMTPKQKVDAIGAIDQLIQAEQEKLKNNNNEEETEILHD